MELESHKEKSVLGLYIVRSLGDMLPICFGDYGSHACDKCPYSEACREAAEAEEDRLAEELFGTDRGLPSGRQGILDVRGGGSPRIFP